MKLKELHPGMYKIRKASTNPRHNNNTVHLLRIKGVGESVRYYFDHDTIGEHPKNINNMEDYEILSKYDREPQVYNPKIAIQWNDASGQSFTFTVHDTWQLKNIFEEMPWLKEAFGYVPQKKRR